MILLKKRED